MPTGEREQLAHAMRLQAPRDQPSAVERRRVSRSQLADALERWQLLVLCGHARDSTHSRCGGGARGGTRTHMSATGPSILSRLRIPISPPGPQPVYASDLRPVLASIAHV